MGSFCYFSVVYLFLLFRYFESILYLEVRGFLVFRFFLELVFLFWFVEVLDWDLYGSIFFGYKIWGENSKEGGYFLNLVLLEILFFVI